MAKYSETQAWEEFVGLLTAISIVSKRLAENAKKIKKYGGMKNVKRKGSETRSDKWV